MIGVMMRIGLKSEVPEWTGIVLICAVCATWLVGSIRYAKFGDPPPEPQPVYTQQEVYGIIKGTRARYERHPWGITLGKEDKERIVASFNKVFNEANRLKK